MRTNRCNATEDSNGGTSDAMQTLTEMMETMRKQNDKRLEEVRRE